MIVGKVLLAHLVDQTDVVFNVEVLNVDVIVVVWSCRDANCFLFEDQDSMISLVVTSFKVLILFHILSLCISNFIAFAYLLRLEKVVSGDMIMNDCLPSGHTRHSHDT